MNLTVLIESAELQVKQILEDFFISVYDEMSLSSHGIDHHRRVWNYSKELLILLDSHTTSELSFLPSKLLIASYLHDIGMSVETGIKHGIHSRDLCMQFLQLHHFTLNDYQDVLDAIEFHDRKDYPGNKNVNEILTILSVADDLDAFGYTGIFRYSEIYLARGIKTRLMGHMIRENAGRRFDNFVKTFGFSGNLVQKHKKRYEILESFFCEYNDQIASYKFGSQNPSGFCGVIEIILYLIKDKKSLSEVYTNQNRYLTDPIVKWFFYELQTELTMLN